MQSSFAYFQKFGYLRSVSIGHGKLPNRGSKWYTLENNDCKIDLYARSPFPDRSGICRFFAFHHRTCPAGDLPFAVDYWWYFYSHWLENHPRRSERDVYQPGRIRPSPKTKMVHCDDDIGVGSHHYYMGNRSRQNITGSHHLRIAASIDRTSGEYCRESIYAPGFPYLSWFFDSLFQLARRYHLLVAFPVIGMVKVISQTSCPERGVDRHGDGWVVR